MDKKLVFEKPFPVAKEVAFYEDNGKWFYRHRTGKRIGPFESESIARKKYDDYVTTTFEMFG